MAALDERAAARGRLGRALGGARRPRPRRASTRLAWPRWRSASGRATTAAPPSGSGPGWPSSAARTSPARPPAWRRPSRELRRTPAPLEAWKSARLLAVLRRRLGDEDGARAAFAEAARSVRTIAAGVRDEALREGFLRLARGARGAGGRRSRGLSRRLSPRSPCRDSRAAGRVVTASFLSHGRLAAVAPVRRLLLP